jgi:hypothetical protein
LPKDGIPYHYGKLGSGIKKKVLGCAFELAGNEHNRLGSGVARFVVKMLWYYLALIDQRGSGAASQKPNKGEKNRSIKHDVLRSEIGDRRLETGDRKSKINISMSLSNLPIRISCLRFPISGLKKSPIWVIDAGG